VPFVLLLHGLGLAHDGGCGNGKSSIAGPEKQGAQCLAGEGWKTDMKSEQAREGGGMEC
jgi:hypothetical protein